MVNKLSSFLKKNRKSEAIYREDLLTKLGREEIKKMIERGLDLPVVLL